MYAYTREPERDFSWGCAGKRIGHLLFAIYTPALSTANSSMLVLSQPNEINAFRKD
jgi:hypothetical protein